MRASCNLEFPSTVYYLRQCTDSLLTFMSFLFLLIRRSFYCRDLLHIPLSWTVPLVILCATTDVRTRTRTHTNTFNGSKMFKLIQIFFTLYSAVLISQNESVHVWVSAASPQWWNVQFRKTQHFIQGSKSQNLASVEWPVFQGMRPVRSVGGAVGRETGQEIR